MLDDVFRISAYAGKKSGRHCIEKVQPNEVQPWLLGDDAAHVDWLIRLLVLTEDRKVDPGEVGTESRAPDDSPAVAGPRGPIRATGGVRFSVREC